MSLEQLFFNFKVNPSRIHLDQQIQELARSLPPQSIVLDAGAGNCPYAKHFSHVQYETADFCQIDKQYGQIDYVCDLANIPVTDDKYDLVIFNQVLEHVPEPIGVLTELRRVLKPGGKIWLSTPLFYEEHEQPHDYYRYTQFGHQYLSQKAGLDIQNISWLEGYYGTLSYQLYTAARALPMHPKDYGNSLLGWLMALLTIGLKPIFFLLGSLFAHLDVGYKNTTIGYCKNYCVVAIKPISN